MTRSPTTLFPTCLVKFRVAAATGNFRGVWHKESAQYLRDLGISKTDLKVVSMRRLQERGEEVKSFFVQQKVALLRVAVV